MATSSCTRSSVGSLACTTLVGLLVIHSLDDGRNRALTVRAMLTLLWPLVLACVVDPSDRSSHALLPATIWMALVWWIDSHALVGAAAAATLTDVRRKLGVSFEAQTVTAMSYGLCGLVGARCDTKHTYLILYALMVCIMVVLPSHGLGAADPLAPLVDEVQRMSLIYAISLLISGVALTRAASGGALTGA